MGSLKKLALAGAAAIVAIPAARAADLPPIIHSAPPVVVEQFAGGWYLRGDIGFSNQSISNLSNAAVPAVTHLDQGFDAAPFFIVGAGYQFNSWLRADVTAEYRGAANFHGLDSYVFNAFNGSVFPDSYSASKSELVFLANLFVDVGTWWCLTPFVGAGVGFADVTISHFRDIGTNVPNGFGGATGFANAASTWNFAWAAYAGLAYKVTPSVSIELAYRYLDLGTAKTGDLVNIDQTQNLGPMNFNHITSQDIMLGVRWMFQQPEPYSPPLVRKG